jgi:hypothetical protein
LVEMWLLNSGDTGLTGMMTTVAETRSAIASLFASRPKLAARTRPSGFGTAVRRENLVRSKISRTTRPATKTRRRVVAGTPA